MIVVAALQTSAWALIALLLCAPAAALSAWSLRDARDAALALTCVRFLALVPFAALALAFGGTHDWLGWLALGGYAPLTLALRDVARGLDPREPQAALALGLRQRDVLRLVTLPLVMRPLAAAVVRVLARLVGEAGLFLVVTGAPMLGARAWNGPLSAVALGITALGWAAVAQRISRQAVRA